MLMSSPNESNPIYRPYLPEILFPMKDHLGRFFEVMADRRSEYIDIGFAFAGKIPEWNFIPHSRADGIGGLREFLEQRGYRVEHARPISKRKKPGFWKWPFLVVRSLADKEVYNFAKVARFNNLQPQFSGDHRPLAKSHVVFSRSETRKIMQAASNKEVTVNTYLLAAIHRVVYGTLTNQDGPIVWYMPVDLRPWLSLGQVKFNVFSMLFVPLESPASAASVHAGLSQMLNEERHWYFWLKLRLAGRLGIFEMIARRPRKTEFHFPEGKKLGFIFSNLGNWTATRGAKTCPPVLFGPPPIISAPAAIGAVTVNGALSLTLALHPAIGLSTRECERLLKKIRSALLTT